MLASKLDNTRFEYEILRTSKFKERDLLICIYSPHEMTTDEELKSFANAFLKKEKIYLKSEISRLTRKKHKSVKIYTLYIYNDIKSFSSEVGADYVIETKREKVFIDVRNYKFGEK